MSYKIEKPNYRWNGTPTPLDPRQVEGTVIHHIMHETGTHEDVDRWHKPGGNTAGITMGIGYNHFIYRNGRIVEGRGFNIGAHVGGKNSRYLGLALQGDFHRDTGAKQVPTTDQLNAAIWLINNVYFPKFHRAKNVYGHGEVGPSSCPGKRFPLAEFKKRVLTNELYGVTNQEEDENMLKLSNYQWNELEKNVQDLLKEKVITSQEWVTKVQNKTLTISELTWLNNMTLMRLRK